MRARLGRDHRRGAVQPAASLGVGVPFGEAARREIRKVETRRRRRRRRRSRRPPTSPTFPTTRRSRLVASARRLPRASPRSSPRRRTTRCGPAHRGALQATRDAAPRARRVAVARCAAARLEEEFLTLLPESIPYLSELFEDPDEEVEERRGAHGDARGALGEDLKSLMATGGVMRGRQLRKVIARTRGPTIFLLLENL